MSEYTRVYGYGPQHKRLGPRSEELYKDAAKVIPGAVTSNVRATLPAFFVKRADGSYIYDVDGNEYIDYVMAMGALLFGHARPKSMIEAVKEQLEKGVVYGQSHELECKVAKELVNTIPCAEMVRFCNSGTEAVEHAIRIARGFTQKEKIAKFEGGYHGHIDQIAISSHPPELDKAGPSTAPIAVTDSRLGVPKNMRNNIVILPYNNEEAIKSIMGAYEDELAALICGGGPYIPPEKGFFKFLRDITKENGAILIWDEVLTGFRMALGGAQEFYGVTPDMSVFGKVLGGGFPIGVVVGRKDLMELVNPTPGSSVPEGERVYYAGTFNGNAITMTAALAVLKELKERPPYDRINRISHEIMEGLEDMVKRLELKAQVLKYGPIPQLYFTEQEITDYRNILTADPNMSREFIDRMIERKILCFSHGFFLSASHTMEDKERTLEAAETVLKALKA